jgi:hypothetical protein
LCSYPSNLSGAFSAFPSAIAPTLWLFQALPGSFHQPLRPPPSLHRRPASTFSPPCQEKGGSPGEAHCITTPSLDAVDSPPPNWLSLQFAPPAPGIIARGFQSFHRHPLTPSMETAWLKRKHHLRKRALLYSLILFPPLKSIHRTEVFGTGSCMVEEEIPPSWQVEEHTMSIGEDKEAEPPLLCANRLLEEHLQLIFEIRQKQDDQLHSQAHPRQRMDILFDALVDAPVRTRCPTCGQKFIPTTTSMVNSSSPKE